MAATNKHPSKQPRRFAVELSTAIVASGLSLTQIATELNNRGLSVTPAALSYWKTGRSLPRRVSSKPIIRELEDILALPERALAHAIAEDLNVSEGAAAAEAFTSSHDEPSTLGHEDSRQFEHLAAQINWENEVHREVFEETLTVSADFRTFVLDTVCLVRIPQTPNPTFHVGCFWEPDNPLTPEGLGIHHLEGAVLTGVDRTTEHEAEMACLEVPPELARPGALHRIAYTHHIVTDKPQTQSIQRLFLWPLRFYTCRVVFEGQVPPAIRWQMITIENDERTKRLLTAITDVSPTGNAVQIALEHVASSLGKFVWGDD